MKEIAEALQRVAYQLACLGNGNAATPMGAVEAFGVVVERGLDSIAGAVTQLADAQQEAAEAQMAIARAITGFTNTAYGHEPFEKLIQQGLHEIATAIEVHK